MTQAVNFFSQCLFEVAGPVFELFVLEFEKEDDPSETIFDRYTSDSRWAWYLEMSIVLEGLILDFDFFLMG